MAGDPTGVGVGKAIGEAALNNIDAYVAFIERGAGAKAEADHWARHLRLVGPPVFVVAARGSAHDEASKVAGLLSQRCGEDYTAFSRVEGPQTTHVFVRR